MKLSIALLLLSGAADSAAAFAPLARKTHMTPKSARAFGVDPSHFADFMQFMPTINLADAADAVSDTLSNTIITDMTASSVDASTVADTAAAATTAATDAVSTAAEKDNGWFGFLTGPTTGLLQLIHSILVAVGVQANAWGVSIVLLTIFIKVVTFPLTKSQLESTSKMQAMQPQIKEIQAKYQSNPEVMNQKIAEFYQVNQINPLAGCLPSLVQIPIFIGLYRAVLDLAEQNKLDEPFLWLPNLEGPTYGADPGTASDWILKGWTDGVPSLGWEDTIAFLSLPLFLVVSQYVSMQIMQPKTDDPAQQQSNAILQVLPIMIGWFSLNVPAALCVYWVVNNIITTATTIVIRNNLKVDTVTPGGAGAATATRPPETIFAPPREKPAGFGSPLETVNRDEVKPITSIVDAEVIDETSSSSSSESGFGDDSSSKKSGGKKKKKRKN